MSARQAPCVCAVCGATFEQPRTGRPRRYCSDACRKRAYRSRAEGRNSGKANTLPIAAEDAERGSQGLTRTFAAAPVNGFATFADLDAWLARHRQ